MKIKKIPLGIDGLFIDGERKLFPIDRGDKLINSRVCVDIETGETFEYLPNQNVIKINNKE